MLVGSVALFLGLILFEVVRALRYSKRIQYLERKSSGTPPWSFAASTAASCVVWAWCFAEG